MLVLHVSCLFIVVFVLFMGVYPSSCFLFLLRAGRERRPSVTATRVVRYTRLPAWRVVFSSLVVLCFVVWVFVFVVIVVVICCIVCFYCCCLFLGCFCCCFLYSLFESGSRVALPPNSWPAPLPLPEWPCHRLGGLGLGDSFVCVFFCCV